MILYSSGSSRFFKLALFFIVVTKPKVPSPPPPSPPKPPTSIQSPQPLVPAAEVKDYLHPDITYSISSDAADQLPVGMQPNITNTITSFYLPANTVFTTSSLPVAHSFTPPYGSAWSDSIPTPPPPSYFAQDAAFSLQPLFQPAGYHDNSRSSSRMSIAYLCGASDEANDYSDLFSDSGSSLSDVSTDLTETGISGNNSPMNARTKDMMRMKKNDAVIIRPKLRFGDLRGECQICEEETFLTGDSLCFRCDRHSKLFGNPWPLRREPGKKVGLQVRVNARVYNNILSVSYFIYFYRQHHPRSLIRLMSRLGGEVSLRVTRIFPSYLFL